jgi:hypothetical protein
VLLTNSTNTLVLQTQRKMPPVPPLVMGDCYVSSPSPNRQVDDQLLGWSERKRK